MSSRAALSHLVGKSSNMIANWIVLNDIALGSFSILYSFGEQFARKFLLLWLVFGLQVAFANQ